MCEHDWRVGWENGSGTRCSKCHMSIIEELRRVEHQLQASQAEVAAIMQFAVGAANAVDELMVMAHERGMDEYELTPYNDYNALNIPSTTAGASIIQRLNDQDEQIKAMRNCANCVKFGKKECQGDYKCYNQGYPYWQWKGGSKGE